MAGKPTSAVRTELGQKVQTFTSNTEDNLLDMGPRPNTR